MKKSLAIIVTFILVLSMALPNLALAHSGRTDSSGGHNCSAKSKAKGLCTGYHYHNGGSSSSGSSSSSSSSSSSARSSTKITKVKVIYNEFPSLPQCKKVEDRYLSSDTYYTYYERIWDCNLYTDTGSIYTHLDLSLYVNNKSQSLSKDLISIQKSSYISVRDFSILSGYNIEVDNKGNVLLKKDGKVIQIFNENNKIFINGKYTNVKAVKAEGSYYIPLRASMGWVNGNIDSMDNSNLYLSIK